MVRVRLYAGPSRWTALGLLARTIGGAKAMWLDWFDCAEVRSLTCNGVATDEAQCIQDLERAIKELR